MEVRNEIVLQNVLYTFNIMPKTFIITLMRYRKAKYLVKTELTLSDLLVDRLEEIQVFCLSETSENVIIILLPMT